MTRVIIHVGGGKCGSSSLQSWLTERQAEEWGLSSTGPAGHVAYVVVGSDGSVRTPALPGTTWHGYYASTLSLRGFATLTDREQQRLCTRICEFGDTVVISNEDWSREMRGLLANPQMKSDLARFFSHFPEQPELVLYVRPQIGWAQSAYLQWGIWQDLDPSDYVGLVVLQGRVPDWSEVVAAFAEVGLTHLRPRYTHDVVQDFAAAILGTGNSAPLTFVNRSISLDLLLLEMRNRELRPHALDPRTEFMVDRILGPSRLSRPVPPLLGQETATAIFESFSESNMSLSERLPTEQSVDFITGAEAELEGYAGKSQMARTQLLEMALDSEYLEQLATDALMALGPTRLDTAADEVLQSAALTAFHQAQKIVRGESPNLSDARSLMKLASDLRPQSPWIREEYEALSKRLADGA